MIASVASLLVCRGSASPHGEVLMGRSDVGSRLAAAQGEIHRQASVSVEGQRVRRSRAPAPEIESNEDGAETFSLAKGRAKP